jgi:hypothetical protein
MTDQYGNYVAQWIITDGKKEDAAAMLANVQGQVLLLSKHKFAVRRMATFARFACMLTCSPLIDYFAEQCG